MGPVNELSWNEDAAVTAEADALCRLIDANAEPLRSAQSGAHVRLDGLGFHLFRSDRNTIYRVEGNHRWYLKMQRDRDERH